MIELLGKRFEGVINAARFVVGLNTPKLLNKWLIALHLDNLIERKYKFVTDILKKQKMVSLLPNHKSKEIKNDRESISRTHINLPFSLFRNRLEQYRDEAYSQPTHAYSIVNQCGDLNEQESFLDNSIQRRLSYWLGLRLPQLRVYSDSLLNELLDKHNAHAMTLGSDIYIRSDKYHPETTEGLALLGHEMTHVAQQYSEPLLPIINDTGIHETEALNNEKLVHLNMRSDITQGNRIAAAQENLEVKSNSPVKEYGRTVDTTPMFAEAGRSLPATEKPVTSSVVSDAEMSRIKQEVYRDIMQKIRLDIERGS